MDNNMIYMPVFRVRQEELKVLKSFEFGERIYPCLEIFKEVDRKTKKAKSFENVHLEIIGQISAKKVFVDLPLGLKQSTAMKVEVLTFLRTVVAKREERTKYLLSLAKKADKIIPVVSSCFTKTGEMGSITKQVTDLRDKFNSIAYRTNINNFKNDLAQINKVATTDDYLIMDFDGEVLDETNLDFGDFLDSISEFKLCPIIILKSSINKITYTSLTHKDAVNSIINDQITKYKDFYGTSFGDYAGIKKDAVTDGGVISPGFLYYDPIENKFYGYKGKKRDLDEFENTIVPDVISSPTTSRMKLASKGFLSKNNVGLRMLRDIKNGIESGKNMAKFKRIAMEHYLHCMRRRILLGELD